MNRRDNIIRWLIISIFVGLYLMTSIVSTIHVIDFFRMSNPEWLAITLAIAFEVGAAASLAAIIILDKTSRWLVWTLFFLITAMQMMGNMYYSYTHLKEYQFWSELFGLVEEDPIFQKRILSFVSGGILPIIALGFIKSLVDYIRPSNSKESNVKKEVLSEEKSDSVDDLISDQETNEYHRMIEEIKADDTLTESEKSRKIEKRIKKALINNPDLKEKMVAELKRIDSEDKNSETKPEEKDPSEIIPHRYGAI